MLTEVILTCKEDGVEFGSRERGFRHWLLSETDRTFVTLGKDNVSRVYIEELAKSRFDYRAIEGE